MPGRDHGTVFRAVQVERSGILGREFLCILGSLAGADEACLTRNTLVVSEGKKNLV